MSEQVKLTICDVVETCRRIKPFANVAAAGRRCSTHKIKKKFHVDRAPPVTS